MINPGTYTLLTIPVFGILYVFTAAGVLMVICLSSINARKPVQYLIMIWAKLIFILMFKRLWVSGKENIDKSKKYILVANHSSLFDIVAISSFYPGVSWFGHERLLKVPLFGRFLRMTDYVPFREPTVTNTRHMLEQLLEKSNNKSVALFPEGTRSTNGKINPFYRGFIYLYKSRDLDILPVTLNGFYEFKPKTRFYIDFSTRLEVIIHKPINHEELTDKTDRVVIEKVRSVIESAHKTTSANEPD
jgi:1-acyl-sn-glycerol-3-phosphate acyltransferase